MFTRTAARKVGKRGRHAVVAALLAAEMAFAPAWGAVAPTFAFADPATGTVTINRTSGNSTTFVGYRLFDATIGTNNRDDDTDNKTKDYATEVAWSQGAQAAFSDFLAANSSTYGEAYTRFLGGASATDPRNALEWISNMISGDANDTDFTGLSAKARVNGTDENIYNGKSDPEAESDDSFFSKKGSDGFALALAKAVRDYNANSDHAGNYIPTVESGATDTTATINGQEGFYLIITKDDSGDETPTYGDRETGTAPIWIAINSGHPKTVSEKSASTSFVKQVVEDRNMADASHIKATDSDTSAFWTKFADAATSQDLWYRMVASAPANINSFATYQLTFDDVLAAGMEPSVTASGTSVSAGVKVILYSSGDAMNSATDTTTFASTPDDSTATHKDITSAATITYADDTKTLSVAIDDVLAAAKTGTAFPVDGNTKVVVYYQAHLTPSNTAFGSTGSVSTAKLTYTADPVNTTSGSSITRTISGESTTTYSYKLDLTKHAKEGGALLDGAKFAIRVADGESYDAPGESGKLTNSDAVTSGYYVAHDGSLHQLTNVGTAKGNILSATATSSERTAWAESNTDGSSKANYVFETGKSTDTSTNFGNLLGRFKGVSDGILQGLDEGTYVIEELVAPGNGMYKLQAAPIYLTITSVLDTSDGLTNGTLSASVSGGEANNAADRHMVTRLGYYEETDTDPVEKSHYTQTGVYAVDGESATTSGAYGVDKTTGLIQLMTVDGASFTMPITGMTGQQLLILLGGTMIAVSLAGGVLIGGRRRKSTDRQ